MINDEAEAICHRAKGLFGQAAIGKLVGHSNESRSSLIKWHKANAIGNPLEISKMHVHARNLRDEDRFGPVARSLGRQGNR